ncbi:MAG: cytochrome C oxidase subunit IV family protein [Planctomycetota bacterium]|jgi:caa(3)-type oxidase subunit IV
MAGDHDASKHVPIYMVVFIALFIGTVVTVAISNVDLGSPWNILVGLAIAMVKASLVAYIFMHLKWEVGGLIWWVLGITVVFFATLMLLPTLTINDLPPGAQMASWSPAPEGAGDSTGDHGGDDH